MTDAARCLPEHAVIRLPLEGIFFPWLKAAFTAIGVRDAATVAGRWHRVATMNSRWHEAARADKYASASLGELF